MVKSLKKYKYIYLIGIGGAGMSALARYFNKYGYRVYGYDCKKTLLCTKLENEGINIHYTADSNKIPLELSQAKKNDLLVIYTPAISRNHVEYKFFVKRGFKLYKRAEILEEITKQSFTIAIAGTHGKTTISTMLTHILYQSDINITAFLGGISKDYNTNLLLSQNEEVIIIEADEYDRSFLKIIPDIAIITSVDTDHMDIYDGEEDLKAAFFQFASQIKNGGLLLVENSIDINFPNPSAGKLLKYSSISKTDYFGHNLRIIGGRLTFDFSILNFSSEIKQENYFDANILLPGCHNVSNAIAALSVGSYLGLEVNKMIEDLSNFKGIERRFERHIENNKIVYIDDYAHHPSEIKATINAVRELYPKRQIMAVFQPHLFTRTKYFAKDFADSLSLVDDLILLDIYPAREKPILGVDSNMLLNLCINSNKSLCSKDEVLSLISQRKSDVILTLGAGDISDLVNPIKQILN